MSETIDITNPSDLVNITPFSEGEARRITEEIKSGFDSLGEKLLEAYRRRAWEPLGYSNFVEYSNAEFGQSKTEAYRLLDSARVTSSLFPEFGKKEIKELSVSQKELLLKLPSEQRVEALKEAQQLAQDEGKKRSTAQHVRRVVEQKMALPPRRKHHPSAAEESIPLTQLHRPKWEGSRNFQIDQPFLWVEYCPLSDGCRFDFYAVPGGKLLDFVELDFNEADSYASPEVAAEYLAKGLKKRKQDQENASVFVPGARVEVVCPRVFVEMPSAPSGSLGTVTTPLDKKGFILIRLDEAPEPGKRQDVKLTPSRLKLLEQGSERYSEGQKIARIEARLNQVLEEKEKLEARIIERDQLSAGLRLQVAGTEAELNQVKAVLESLQLPEYWVYCGATFRGPVEVAGAKKTLFLQIESGCRVVISPGQHSQPGLCYVRPIEEESWLDGIAVRWKDLKPLDGRDELISSLQAENAALKLQFQQESESPQLKPLDEALQAADQQRLVIEEYQADVEALKKRIASLLDERGTAQAEASSDALEIELLSKFNDRLKEENAELNKVCAELQTRLDALTQSVNENEQATAPGEEEPSEVARFNLGEIKTRTELERFCSRRQMDESRREEKPLSLSDGSVWRMISRENNETLWRDLGHRPNVSLFECISLEFNEENPEKSVIS